MKLAPLLRWLLICLNLTVSSAVVADTVNQHSPEKPLRVFIMADLPSVSEYRTQFYQTNKHQPTAALEKQHAHLLRQEQQRLAKRITPFLLKEHSALRVALNGFRASVNRSALADLRAVPGVKSVTSITSDDIDNIYSVPWVEAPKFWDNYSDGADMTIAIIDTGIDYLHANFGGNGDAQDYESNNLNVIEPGTFPTAKVIGGWDFAGPTYNSREEKDPEPDPDPLDGHGHGSHVAGTAAGLGVSHTIGPGVAKGAKLLALKVFSDIGGSTDLTIDAIEMALDPNGDGSMEDHVDVINMSLGARFGLPTDPSAIAASNAMNAGVIVVASAGNNGDIPYITGSPGVGAPVISVAAALPGDRRQIALAVLPDNTPQHYLQWLQAKPGAASLAGPTVLPALEGSGPVRINHVPNFSNLALAKSLDDDNNLSITACQSIKNIAQVQGRVALVWRGECNFRDKYHEVQAAGGIGIVVVNTSDDQEDLIIMGALVENITIPGLMITLADGEQLRQSLTDGSSVTVGFSTGFTVPVPPHQNDVLADFSSRGPGAGGSVFKPDLTAPGRFIVSTQAGSGQLGIEKRGTSMAAPHVAGMAALLRQANPDWSTATIKSALQNAAAPSHRNGPGSATPVTLTRQGAGVIRGASSNHLNAYASPGGVSFGYLNVLKDETRQQTVQLTRLNQHGNNDFDITHVPVSEIPGAVIECPSSVAVNADGHADFIISLTITASALPADDARSSQREANGWCELSNGSDTLRVSYMAAIDGASDITAKSGDLGLQLENRGAVRGIANSFVLSAARQNARPESIAAVGWRESELFTFPLLELAVVMNQPWESPSNLRWAMFLDVDFDQQYERVLFSADWSQLGFEAGTLVTGIDFVSDIADIGSDRSITHWFVEHVDFNDRVITIPFFMTPDGGYAIFKPSETEFNFRLVVADRYDQIEEIHGYINLLNPAGSQQQSLTLDAGESVTVPPSPTDQLWLFPTNINNRQSLTVPAAQKINLRSLGGVSSHTQQ